MTARVQRVRRAVELAVRHKVAGQLDGVHASLHVGRSLDFVDLREYVQGDDVGDIDWRATARAGTLLVKRQVAERRLVVLLVVATGRGLAGLATSELPKSDVALDAAATLGVLASSFGDYSAVLWWEDGRARAGRPSSRLVELERQLSDAEVAIAPTVAPTDLPALLASAGSTLRRRGLVAVIADDVDLDPHTEARLKTLSAQHQVLWLTVPDADPTAPELAGRNLLDLDGGGRLPEWLDDPALRSELADDRGRRAKERASALARLGIAEAVLAAPDRVSADVISLVRRMRRAA